MKRVVMVCKSPVLVDGARWNLAELMIHGSFELTVGE